MAASSPWSPVEEYMRRRRLREQQVERHETRHIALGYLKLLLIAATIAIAWLSRSHSYRSLWLPGIPILLFIAVAVYHSRVLRRQADERRAVEFYSKGLARIGDDWPRTTERSLPEQAIMSSLYARDLDIVGKGSLFELLCVARTRMGEQCLLAWLLHAASPETIYRRQNAVSELRGQLDFREEMAVTGEAVSIGVWPESLKQWGASTHPFASIWLRWLAAGLTLLAVGAAAFWLTHGFAGPLLAVLVAQWCLVRYLKRRIALTLDGADKAFQNLKLVSALLHEIEQQHFEGPHLQSIQKQLFSGHIAASEAIAQLGKIVDYLEALANPFVRLFNLPLMYTVQLAFAIHAWRERHGHALASWLDSLGEMEALLSLAAYSYEHPEDPFPTFVDGPGNFHAEYLGHPLIPAAKCVRNSVDIGEPARVLLVSGSNMSGKSTLMRTVGINTVLALCGAPVRAKRMQLTPLRIGASLLVNDSLQRGASRFYAEIEKLQAICSLAQQSGPPLLFLLDELLQGTNSKDRRIGAEGVTRELVEAGAIGILTTHDLSLTHMDHEDGMLRNMHFQDAIVDGKMQFDFLLQEGVVTKSNGVELMRLIGLKV
ncbi:mismatch repair protein [Terriglobus albidus]|uniref:Mismatch repair protein n=2 Tax=Terriglobus albidus TaxID=1592106 RepID=A0A5B9E6M4_9BACT|nr:mismatch repair protein [Terriglobus albidus]